jgi:hypothetical protein
MLKDEDEKAKKNGWMVKYYTSLLQEKKWSLNLYKMKRKKVNFVFIFDFFFSTLKP